MDDDRRDERRSDRRRDDEASSGRHHRSKSSRDSSHRRSSRRDDDDADRSSRRRGEDRGRDGSRRRRRHRDDPRGADAGLAPAGADAAHDEGAGRLASYLGYSDEANPFGDPNLTKRFVWKKRDAVKGSRAVAEGGREAAIVKELQAVEQRRREREEELVEKERLRAEEDRMREEEQHGSYEDAERAFDKVQHRRRTVIRVRGGRERPSDTLVKNLVLVEAGRLRASPLRAARASETAALVADPAVDFELSEPYSVVDGLPASELESLLRELASLREMGAEVDGTVAAAAVDMAGEAAAEEAERAGASGMEAAELVRAAREGAEAEVEAKGGRYRRYWDCVAVVAGDALSRARAGEAGDTARSGIGGLHPAVERDVVRTLAWRDAAGLSDMEAQVRGRADAAGAGAAAGLGGGLGPMAAGAYWPAVLRAVAVMRARLELRAAHRGLLRQRERDLEAALAEAAAEAGVPLAADGEEGAAGGGEGGAASADEAVSSSSLAAGGGGAAAAPASALAAPPRMPARAESPTPVRGEEAAAAGREATGLELEVLTPAELQRTVELARERAAERLARRRGGGSAADGEAAAASASSEPLTVEQAIAKGLLRDGESTLAEADEVFTGPAAVDGAIDTSMLSAEELAAFADRYRPRKPRYVARVRTGYHWNSHNKAYYDRDNPPPKTVQGYKFNVFYPDLLDPSKPPSFSIEPADSASFCVLRIHGGPPYEDVAFKVINREWLTGKRSGYISSFDRGVFKLFFNLKTHFYRH